MRPRVVHPTPRSCRRREANISIAHRIDPAQELDERRTAALSEIELFRNTLDTLRARLPNLEHFIANSGPAADAAEFDEITRTFGNPGMKGEDWDAESELEGGADEEGAEARERKRTRMLTEGEYDREGTATGTDPDDTAAVEAAVDLEFTVRRNAR